MHKYSGCVEFINKTGAELLYASFSDGIIEIDDSVDAGQIILSGVGDWINKETYAGNATITDNLVSSKTIETIKRDANLAFVLSAAAV